ncbi:hypothetical protein NDU88_004021 [Pleurodeles waltl]|uniref:Uncharacterized protein n=1 Tax=Pleurodeles waltl TaxID=8319 RepID=A0AAV7PBJ5_PLEWA|nr:hypothetical protein NDU88_004021 [Pleurodeles waltl]
MGATSPVSFLPCLFRVTAPCAVLRAPGRLQVRRPQSLTDPAPPLPRAAANSRLSSRRAEGGRHLSPRPQRVQENRLSSVHPRPHAPARSVGRPFSAAWSGTRGRLSPGTVSASQSPGLGPTGAGKRPGSPHTAAEDSKDQLWWQVPDG